VLCGEVFLHPLHITSAAIHKRLSASISVENYNLFSSEKDII